MAKNTFLQKIFLFLTRKQRKREEEFLRREHEEAREEWIKTYKKYVNSNATFEEVDKEFARRFTDASTKRDILIDACDIAHEATFRPLREMAEKAMKGV